MRQAQKEALEWIIANPGDFLGLTLQRIAYLWLGPLHRPRDALGVLALTLLAIWVRGGSFQGSQFRNALQF